MNETILKRQQREQELLLEQLRKTPIAQIACDKLKIGRATYYRWRKQNKEFAEQADLAIAEGKMLMNDMAESQLLNAVKNSNFPAIKFWLQSHHPAYSPKLQIDGKFEHWHTELTEKQKELLEKALKLAGLEDTPLSLPTEEDGKQQ